MFFPPRRIPVRQLGQQAPGAQTALSADEQFYRQVKGELLAEYAGQFALIYQQQFVAAYPTYEDAFSDATQRGLPAGGFLIKEITEEEPIETI